jgi:glycosyltransferase involved in cell wall biosynthesis
MIKILQLSGNSSGGVRKHVHSIIKNIDSDIFELHYGFSTAGIDSEFSFDKVNFKKNCIFLIPMRIYKAPHLTDIRNILLLIDYIKRNDIDIIHAHGAKAGVYARVLAKINGVRNIYTPHGGVLHNQFGIVASKIYLYVEKLLLPYTTRIVAESQYTKSAYLKKVGWPELPIIVNYNGISQSDCQPTRSIQELEYKGEHFGIFARLSELKGQHLAVKAFASLPKNYYLHLFGDGDDKLYLLDLIKSLKMNNRVFIHGDVKCVEMIMKKLNGVLIPSYFESFSYVAIEAMMLKVPVFAFSVGGLIEVVSEKSGVVMGPVSVENIIHSVENITSLDVSNMVDCAYRRYLDYFTEMEMVENLEKIYLEIV